MISNFIIFIAVFFCLGIPIIMLAGSVVMLIAKILERKREKETEDLDKYKDY